MTVIFGIKEDDEIIIAGDKRGSDVNGGFISDDLQKVIPINNHLCIAFAGNAAIKSAIMKNVEEVEQKNKLFVEDLLEIIDSFYKKVRENGCDVIYSYSFYGLIAGKGTDGKAHLYNVGKFKNGFAYKEVPMALYPPLDTNQDECNNIFVKNYKLHRRDFVERTIKEISQMSNTVSPTGNSWTYGFTTHTGEMNEINGDKHY